MHNRLACSTSFISTSSPFLHLRRQLNQSSHHHHHAAPVSLTLSSSFCRYPRQKLSSSLHHYHHHPHPHPQRPFSTKVNAIFELSPSTKGLESASHVVTLISDKELSFDIFNSINTHIMYHDASVISWTDLSDRAAQIYLKNIFDDETFFNLSDALNGSIAKNGSIDVVLQSGTIVRSPKRLAIFDLDSTLIQQETIDEMATELGLQNQVSEITQRAMEGQLDFKQALEQRVALLKGLPIDSLENVKQRVSFTPGAKQLVNVLRKIGCKTAVISGGFQFLAYHVRDQLGLDYAFANDLDKDHNNSLTGSLKGPIVDAKFKRDTLKKLAKQFNVDRSGIIAVGDGSNDLLMLKEAGLGIAFNAKPIVQDEINTRINTSSLYNVLYLLGMSDDEIDTALKES